MDDFTAIRIGYAMTGSFCTLSDALEPLRRLVELRADVQPIFSTNVAHTDTRFFAAADLRSAVRGITGKEPWDTLVQVEAIGPKKLLDLLIVCPCTGNTMGKLAAGITDTPVVMACKSHLRNARPVLLALATNDGLSASAGSLGALLNRKNVFFVPFGQDAPISKPCSLMAKLSLLPQAAAAALEGRQLQPVLA